MSTTGFGAVGGREAKEMGSAVRRVEERWKVLEGRRTAGLRRHWAQVKGRREDFMAE